MTRIPRIFATAAASVLLLPTLAFGQVGETIDNSTLQAKVKTKLMADDMVTGTKVNLETESGVVQLGGFVDDEAKAKRAADIVAGVEGVKKVDNQLHVRPAERSAGQAIDDGMITTKLKAQYADADLGTASDINIDTYNGVVLLTGFVDSDGTKALAEEVAGSQDGVKKVINGLYVRN